MRKGSDIVPMCRNDLNGLWVDLKIQFQSRSMSDTTFSNIDFKNKKALVWTTLKSKEDEDLERALKLSLAEVSSLPSKSPDLEIIDESPGPSNRTDTPGTTPGTKLGTTPGSKYSNIPKTDTSLENSIYLC